MCAVLWAQWQLQLWGLKQTAGSRHRQGEALSSGVRQASLSWSVAPLLPGSVLRRELITATPLVRRGFGAVVDGDLSKQEMVHLQTTNCLRVCFSPMIIHFLWSRNCLNVLIMFLSLCFNELMNSLTHSLLTLQWASNYNTQKMFSISRNQDSRKLLLGW